LTGGRTQREREKGLKNNTTALFRSHAEVGWNWASGYCWWIKRFSHSLFIFAALPGNAAEARWFFAN
jgi:hypothetical protein